MEGLFKVSLGVIGGMATDGGGASSSGPDPLPKETVFKLLVCGGSFVLTWVSGLTFGLYRVMSVDVRLTSSGVTSPLFPSLADCTLASRRGVTDLLGSFRSLPGVTFRPRLG